MHHTDRKLSIYINLDTRIADAKRKQEWVWKQSDMTAMAKATFATQQQAIEMALTRLRDESQTETDNKHLGGANG
tara:strand:- start:368 stop:592 length:225 start_codon:yes stop_codon:yes gene_type:complete